MFLEIYTNIQLSNSGQGISHHIIFTFNVLDVQVEFLQGQAPPHQPLIFVFHPMDEGEGVVVSKDKHWVNRGTQVDNKML